MLSEKLQALEEFKNNISNIDYLIENKETLMDEFSVLDDVMDELPDDLTDDFKNVMKTVVSSMKDAMPAVISVIPDDPISEEIPNDYILGVIDEIDQKLNDLIVKADGDEVDMTIMFTNITMLRGYVDDIESNLIVINTKLDDLELNADLIDSFTNHEDYESDKDGILRSISSIRNYIDNFYG